MAWTQILSCQAYMSEHIRREGIGREEESKDTAKYHSCSSCWVAFTFCYSRKSWRACSKKCQFCTDLQWKKYEVTYKPAAREYVPLLLLLSHAIVSLFLKINCHIRRVWFLVSWKCCSMCFQNDDDLYFYSFL